MSIMLRANIVTCQVDFSGRWAHSLLEAMMAVYEIPALVY